MEIVLAREEANLTAAICRESFYEFLLEFWDVIVPEKYVHNWHIPYLCNELQVIAERVFTSTPKEYDLIINVPPGTTKSTIASVALCPWAWTRMPSFRHLCATHTDTLALNLGRLSRSIVESEKYRRCFPEIELADDQNTKGFFVNTKGGGRITCTIGGRTPMGFHAHFHTVDDPIDPKKVTSDIEIKAANDWIMETLPSRKVDKRVTPLALIMQRLHQDDPSGHLREKKKNIRDVILPAELHDNISPPELRANYIDGLLDPNRITRTVLEEAKLESNYAYAGQYLQDPVPLGGGQFIVAKLHIWVPPSAPFVQSVRFWDKAGTLGGGAYTVGTLMHKTSGATPQFWVTDVVRGQWDSAKREQIILETAKRDGKKVRIGIEEEPGSGGKESAQNTVARLAGYHVQAYKVGQAEGNKANRADPFSSQVNGGNVWLYEDKTCYGYQATGAWIVKFIDEMRFFPRSRYKDQMDSASGAFNMLTKPRTRVGAL